MSDFTTVDLDAEAREIDRLDALMARGHSQHSASLALWSNCPISSALSLEIAGRDARRRVRDGLLAWFPWLRLPGGGDL